MQDNKVELPGASDKLPKETLQALEAKPSIAKVRRQVSPPSDKYTPFDFSELQGESLVKDLETPSEYYYRSGWDHVHGLARQ